MKRNILCLFILFNFITVSLFAQDDYLYEEEEVDSSRFSFGLNFGAFFSSNKTAFIYTGSPQVTAFSIPFVFNQPFNEQRFRDYFRYDYYIAEYPFDPVYKTSSEIGIHLGYKVGKKRVHSVYLDFNTIQLKFEQFFTVAIDDPRNRTVGPTFEQIPLFGRENRFYLNLGTQLSFYHDEAGSNAYFALFANLNNVQMRRNYFVIDNQEYEIYHRNFNNPNQRLGGIGYGGGTGLGFKFKLTEQIKTDFYYHLMNTQTNLKEDLQAFGFQHALGIRVIWG